MVTKAGEPALPLAALNVTPTDPSIVLRGVGIRGGTYVDSAPLLPFSGAPTTELRGVHVPFASPVFYPGRLSNPNYFGALAENGGTQLLVTPAQHRIANLANGTSTQRRFTGLDLRLYYSGDLSQAALSDAPTIVGVEARQERRGRRLYRAGDRRSESGDSSGLDHVHERWRRGVDVARPRSVRRAASGGVRHERRLAACGWDGSPARRPTSGTSSRR